MKTVILRNHCYSTEALDDSYDFAVFELTKEFVAELKNAIALSESESETAFFKFRASDKAQKNAPVLQGHIYAHPGFLTYFSKDTLKRYIKIEKFEELATISPFKVIDGRLPEKAYEHSCYTSGAFLEVRPYRFRWHNTPRDVEATLFTDWIWTMDEPLWSLLSAKEKSSDLSSLKNQIAKLTAEREALRIQGEKLLKETDELLAQAKTIASQN